MRLPILSAALVCAVVTSAEAALTHRFDFNTDGQIVDRVGSITGTLVNGATVAGGQLVFDAGVNTGTNTDPATGQYATLSADPLRTRAFTVEAWSTWRGGANWQRIIDVGRQVPGNGGTIGQGFAMLTMGNNSGNPIGQVSINSWGDPSDTNVVAAPSFNLRLNRQQHIVWTHNPAAGQELFYIDGQLVGNGGATVDPSRTNYTQFFLGRSMFTADPFFAGSINELNTYDTALTPQQVTANRAAGPSTVPEPGAVAAVGAVAVGLLRRRRATA